MHLVATVELYYWNHFVLQSKQGSLTNASVHIEVHIVIILFTADVERL